MEPKIEAWYHGQEPSPWRVACFTCLGWWSFEFSDVAADFAVHHADTCPDRKDA